MKFSATVEVHVTLKSDQADINFKLKEIEEFLTKAINDILRSTDPTNQHSSATKEAVQQLEAVVEHLRKIGLSNSRLSESIILSFHCRSLEDLQKVNDELFNSENVKTMIKKVYADMGILSANGTDSLVCQWHKNSYNRCYEFFQGIVSFVLYSSNWGKRNIVSNNEFNIVTHLSKLSFMYAYMLVRIFASRQELTCCTDGILLSTLNHTAECRCY